MKCEECERSFVMESASLAHSRDVHGQDVAATMNGVTLPVSGLPATDVPHGFGQDEGSSSLWCSECGRSKNHPIHTGG